MATRNQNPRARSVDGLTRRQDKRDASFFAELDRAKNKFGSFWFITIIVLVIFFVGLIVAALNLKRQSVSIKNSTDSVDDNISLSFSDRLASVNSLGATTLVFNGEEFVKASGADSDEFPLKNCKFIFSEDQIVLSGKTRDSWIPISVKLKINAVAAGEKFSFVVAPNDLENIVVYGQNKEKIEQNFEKNINLVLKENNMIAKDVEISDDRLELSVIKERK